MAFATVVGPYNRITSPPALANSDISTCFDGKLLDCEGASPDPESLYDTLEKSLGLNFDGLMHGPNGIKGKCMPKRTGPGTTHS